MKYRIAYGTSIGGRRNQEDCLFVAGEIFQTAELTVLHRELERQALLLAVCDGMGGHASGELASRFVCERLPRAEEEYPSTPEEVDALARGIQFALELAPPGEGGTTLAAVAVRGSRVLAFAAGDSRVYRISPEGLSRVTPDHSLVQQLIDSGELTRETAFDHPYRNVISFGFGSLFTDEWGKGEQQVHCAEGVLAPGTYYLVCSDGVFDVLRDPEILEALGRDPLAGVPRLLERLHGRMIDNTSFILLAAG